VAWPKGRPRPKKVGTPNEAPAVDDAVWINEAAELAERDPSQPPPDWRKGALLNVRNHGAEYIITLYPEEYDPRYQERCLKFTNLGECQDFVSKWYARESHNPLAR
jgi:hypothetical protein